MDYKKIIICLVVGLIIGIGGTLFVQRLLGPKQTVNITGEGNIEVTADQATINITVTNSSWSQTQAEADNKKDTEELKSKLITLGIPESRITTSNNFIQPFTDTSLPVPQIIPGSPPLVGDFQKKTGNSSVTTNLIVTLDSIKGIDKVFAAINSVTTAKISNTDYSLKNPSSYQSQVREKAVLDARTQVESIAKINHLHVGKLLSINSGYSNQSIGLMKGASFDSNSPSVANTNISYGEKTIPLTATYNVSYELY